MSLDKPTWGMVAVAVCAAGLLIWGIVALVSDDAEPSWNAARAPGSDGGAGFVSPVRPALAARQGSGPHALSGTVVDGSGAAVSGAQITAELELGPGVGGKAPDPGQVAANAVVAISEASGAFELAGLDAGRFRLRVEGPGVVAAEVRFVEVPSSGIRLVVAREVTVEGEVVDILGKPAAGVTVQLVGDGDQPPRSIDTGTDGRFAFDGLLEGVYHVWGVRETEAAPAVRAPRAGAGPFDPVRLVLGPAAVVEGRTIDSGTGFGVAAQVALVAADDSDEPIRRGISGPDGRFRIPGVPFGNWTAQASAAGYIAAEAITFRAGELSPELTLARGAVLAGQVVDADGRPIAGAVVSARGKDADGRSREYSELTLLARVQAHRGAGTASPDALGARFIPRGELGVVVGPVPFPPPAGAAALRVASPVAPPVASALDVPPIPADPAMASSFVSDAGGRFRLTGLEPGTYRVLATHPEHADGGSEPIALELGREVAGMRIVLSPGVIVFGRVVDDRGREVAGASVTASSPGAMLGAVHAITGLDGNYSLGPFGADVVVSVSAVGHGAAERRIELGELPRTRVEREENFVLGDAGARIEGRVRDRGGYAVAGATVTVQARRQGLPGRFAATDDQGRFRVELLPEGDYVLRVEHPDYPVQEVAARTGVHAEVTVDIGGGLELIVRDAHTRVPVVAARVVGRGPGGSAAEQVTGTDGRAALRPLAAGAWSFQVTAAGFVPGRTDARVPAASRARELTVRDVVVDLTRGASIAGIVRDDNGQRVSGARVSVGAQTAQTNVHGEFGIRDVITGDVVVVADKQGKAGEVTVSLRPGDELVTLEITIRP